jgi:hypothetical protein
MDCLKEDNPTGNTPKIASTAKETRPMAIVTSTRENPPLRLLRGMRPNGRSRSTGSPPQKRESFAKGGTITNGSGSVSIRGLVGKTSTIYFVRTMSMRPYFRQRIPFVNVFFALKRKIEPRMATDER